jgi:hypothetical protein
MSMGIGYDTYRIRGYAIFQKTPIRGYGSNILIIIKNEVAAAQK